MRDEAQRCRAAPCEFNPTPFFFGQIESEETVAEAKGKMIDIVSDLTRYSQSGNYRICCLAGQNKEIRKNKEIRNRYI